MQKTALVTGGARGIGRSIVAELAEEYQVVYTHLSTTPSDDIPGTPILCDLSDQAAPDELVAEIIERFGRLDVIVNNAGVVAETPIESTNRSAHRLIFEVNVLAPMALLAAALPTLAAGASVINITSTNARLPAMSAPAYSASKAALETWTRAMAKVLGPKGIRVNAVAPGATEIPEAPRSKEMQALFLKDTALGALSTPQDIGAAVRFLASPAAKAITGQILDVNGGYRL